MSVTDQLNTRATDRLVRAARAAHTLSETLWEELHEELASPEDGERIAELSRRLADTAATVALLAGGRERKETHGPHVPAQRAAPKRSAPSEPALASPGPRPMATLVDELAPEDDRRRGSPAEIKVRDRRGTESDHAIESQARHVREGGVESESEKEEAPTPWVASIARRVERYERDREPFAVLVLELVDIERLRHAELPGVLARLTGLVEAALASELRPADSLMRESPGRYWLLAPETDPEGARALAGRLADAVGGAASHRGEPLQIAAGIAACPSDGLAAGTLAAHADIGLYAARAAGRPLAP